jgi:hypothetical protein
MVFSTVPESSSCHPVVLFGSRAFLALRWMMPGIILGEVASRCLYVVTKPSHMGGEGADVDMLAYPLHRPTARSCQSRGLGLPARHHHVLSL